MACFIVPVTEAVITTVAAKVIKNRENKNADDSTRPAETVGNIKFSAKLGWLNKMLWGGSALLAFEHLWHGELTPFFPFLTAVKTGEVSAMLSEMASVGTVMALTVTAVWACAVAVCSSLEKRALREEKDETDGASA